MPEKIMDEEEYLDLLARVFCDIVDLEEPEEMLDEWYRGVVPDPADSALREQLRDEDGFRVEGCYRVLKAPTI